MVKTNKNGPKRSKTEEKKQIKKLSIPSKMVNAVKIGQKQSEKINMVKNG